jgi:hypothetical protein
MLVINDGDSFVVELAVPDGYAGVKPEDVHVSSRGSKIIIDCVEANLTILDASSSDSLAEAVKRDGIGALQGARLFVRKVGSNNFTHWEAIPTKEHGSYFFVLWWNYIQLKQK